MHNRRGRNVTRESIKIGLLGLGVVGSGVARALIEKADVYAQLVGCPLELVRVLERDPRPERMGRLDPARITSDPDVVLEDRDIDIVIELLGGERPASEFIERALRAGKFVVTANKEVMAKHGPEIISIARERGVDILYEASVGGGIPIIAPLKRDLLGNEIRSISAIINGTTNYILTSMAKDGRDFDEALRQAQAMGYAEANPDSDILGHDAAYKLAILASLAFHTEVRAADVHREGITNLTARDFRYAAELGYAIKLLAFARREGNTVEVRVHPALISRDEQLAKVDGVLNAIQVEGDLVGRVWFEGPGAGSLAASSAVVGDVIDAARSVAWGFREPGHARRDACRILPMAEVRTRYYLRLTVADRPGVLAHVARVVGDLGISIASVIQKEADADAQTAEIVIMTHPAPEAATQAALRQLAELEVVRETGNFIRVEG